MVDLWSIEARANAVLCYAVMCTSFELGQAQGRTFVPEGAAEYCALETNGFVATALWRKQLYCSGWMIVGLWRLGAYLECAS